MIIERIVVTKKLTCKIRCYVPVKKCVHRSIKNLLTYLTLNGGGARGARLDEVCYNARMTGMFS